MYSEFPFSKCCNSHLKESPKLIHNGIRAAVRDYSKVIVPRLDSIHDMKESAEVYEWQPHELNTNSPGNSILKPGGVKAAFTLSMAATKIEVLIRETYCDIVTDPHFHEIKNFVVNTILQSFPSTSPISITNKIFSKNYRDTLLGDIDRSFQDKYIELKIDDYFDASATFLLYCRDLAPGTLLAKPRLYETYRAIWKLDNDDHKLFDRKYFLREHFRVAWATTVVDEYFRIGFLMNLDRFMQYFSREISEGAVLVCDDNFYDSDLSTASVPYLNSSVDTLDTVSISESVPKSLRFDDHVDIVGINKEEPAFYVNHSTTERSLSHL